MKADLLPQKVASSGLRPDLAGEALELGRPRDKRGQVEAEGLFDRTPLPPSGVALAIGAVAPDHQPGRDQLRQGSSQSRWSRPVRSNGQFAVGWEYDDVVAGCQRRVRMKGESARGPRAPGLTDRGSPWLR